MKAERHGGERRHLDRAIRVGILLVAAALVVQPALGQEEEATALSEWSPEDQRQLERFCGTYRNVLDDGGAEVIADAMNPVIEEIRPAIRGMGRRRLFGGNLPIPRVTIRARQSGVRVDLSNERVFDTPMGDWRTTRGPAGTRLRVSHRLQGNKLIETMLSRLGGARHTFTLRDGGRRLRFRGRIWGGALPTDIVYSLDFVRVGETR